ncbi:hypothetical protein ACQPZX_38275 [Actinoplanes sp. CA-142083]|uniref:hypothetical protein n=1 Tax=Actinoplanes sp. CA-142083 TaxID=3239903 RepID=UPI003D90C49C
MAGKRRLASLGVALAAAGTMLFAPAAGRGAEAAPVNARVAWPGAQRGVMTAALGDGTLFEPAVFVDAKQAVGTALTADGKTMRLLLRRADGTARSLRTLPMSQNPSFESATIDGQTLVWAESTKAGEDLWTADLRDGRPPRRLTADLGDARFYQSQYDLVVAEGRVHWVAAGAGDTTEVRSVDLRGGGPVEVRQQPGTWALSAWPWLIDGLTAAAGTTRLRNLTTGETRAVPAHRRGVTACSPVWCQVVAFDKDGYPRIDLVRPDGEDRRKVADGTAATVIADPAVLDRFEIFSQQTGNSDLTGHVQLLAYKIDTRTVVEISPDATDVSYKNGVLWWSTGTQEDYVRHSLDLRSV